MGGSAFDVRFATTSGLYPSKYSVAHRCLRVTLSLRPQVVRHGIQSSLVLEAQYEALHLHVDGYDYLPAIRVALVDNIVEIDVVEQRANTLRRFVPATDQREREDT